MVEVLKIISVDVNVSSKFVMNFGLIFYIRDMILGEKELLFNLFIGKGFLEIYFYKFMDFKIVILDDKFKTFKSKGKQILMSESYIRNSTILTEEKQEKTSEIRR